VTLVKTDIEVVIPDPQADVPFTARVFPSAAADGGCRATPTAYTLPEGTEVVFQALPANGFTFAGWYLGANLLSTDAIAKIAVSPPAAGEAVTVYEARFSPV
jgi:hypothetical protein